ncbi:MAG: tetratricopeptide repeat protein [Campylobacteraceae bacterium]
MKKILALVLFATFCFSAASDIKEFEERCAKGELSVCAYLGYAYANGDGVKANKQKAISFYDKSCTQKESSGCLGLGLLLYDENANSKDRGKAAAAFDRVCSKSELGACSYATYIYLYDESNIDYKKALKNANMACANKQINSCYDEAFIYENGLGVEKDLKKAVSLYAQTCQKTKDFGCVELTKIYEADKDAVKDYANFIIEMNDLKCKQSNKDDSCITLGSLYQHSDIYLKKDIQRAIMYYSKACDSGNVDSCNLVGSLYYNGAEVNTDYKKASEFLNKSCDMDSGFGCYWIGLFNKDGLGIEKNAELSNNYFKKACDLNYKQACDLVQKP